MSVYRTRALVLKTRNFGEADRVLLLLTEDHGKFEAAVKGARRQRSRFVGNTLPFNLLNALFFSGKNLEQLSQAELIHPFSALREDLIKMAYATFWVELVDEFVPERQTAPEIFRFLLAALITLEKSSAPGILNLAFQMRLLNYLGYQPQLDGCAGCGTKLLRTIQFSIEAGGIICPKCAKESEEQLMAISPEELRFLKMLTVSDIRKLDGFQPAGTDLNHIKALLRTFIEARLDRPLKSQVFLDSVLSE